MNTDPDTLDKHLRRAYAEIAEAAAGHDLSKIGQLFSRASQLEELKNQYASLQRRIASLDNESTEIVVPLPRQPSTTGLRDLAVSVTEGMKRQNLLTLTPHVKRGRIKPGEQLIIEAVPSGHRFQTELLEQGNRLRARGEIAQFYRDAGVNDGDYVLLSEIAPGTWTLKKAPRGICGPATFSPGTNTA